MKNIKLKVILVSILLTFYCGNSVYSQENYIVAGYNDSTITYYDINPDTIIQTDGFNSSEALNIDFDNDGIDDFTIAASSFNALGGSSSSITFTPKNANKCVLGRIDTVYGYTGPWTREVVKIQNLGDTINCNLNFTESVKYITLNSYQEGYHFYIADWIDIGEKYLAFEFVSNDSTYYGWIRIEVTGIGLVYIKDYAFNKKIYLGIKNPDTKNLISIFPNPTNDFINIKINNNEKSKVSIIDISGKILWTYIFNKSIKLKIKEFHNGLYILKIENNNNLETRKIVIK